MQLSKSRDPDQNILKILIYFYKIARRFYNSSWNAIIEVSGSGSKYFENTYNLFLENYKTILQF